MSSTQSNLLCNYRYDPLDRLIDQTRQDQPTHQRFYCKSRLATEIQGAMRYSILQHGDLLLAQLQRQGDEVSATLLATDLQRSVLHTLEKNHQRQTIAYSPYGYRCVENGLTSLLGFNGERPDPVTGHYLLGNGYRAFNPVLMRFNSPDSWSPFGKGGLNSYNYCLGNPSNRKDPSGRASVATISNILIHSKQWLSRARANLKLAPEDRRTLLLNYRNSTKLNLRRNAYLRHLEITSPGLSNSNPQPLSLKQASVFKVYEANIPLDSLPPPITALVKKTGPIGQFKPLLEFLLAPSKWTSDFDLSQFTKNGVYTPRNAAPNRRVNFPGSKIEEYDRLLPKSFPTASKINEQLEILQQQIRG